jgi:hypothetical protein
LDKPDAQRQIPAAEDTFSFSLGEKARMRAVLEDFVLHPNGNGAGK